MLGLSSEEHCQRLVMCGKNVLVQDQARHWWVKLFWNMICGFQLFYFVVGILCLMAFFITKCLDYQTLELGILCFLVFFIMSLFQFYQEDKCEKLMSAFKSFIPDKTTVIRDGSMMEVPTESLVPGDICIVKGGEKVPADVRILTSSDLYVNHAALTGESMDIKLGTEATRDNIMEANNLARMGGNFTEGTGIVVVFATAANAFLGKIYSLILPSNPQDSYLKKEIKRMMYIMGVVAISIGVIFFIIALALGYSIIDALVLLIGIIVANMPTGLMPHLQVSLNLSLGKMMIKGFEVSNLDMIENLGALTVLCCDKTGTLTCNRMTVSHVFYNKTIHKTAESQMMNEENIEMYEANDPHFQALLKIATLSSTAEFLTQEPNVLSRKTSGSSSEGAFIKFVQPIRDIINYRKQCPKIFGIPFNSRNKWTCSIHDEQNKTGNKALTIMLTGAAEKVIGMCGRIMKKGEVQVLEAEEMKELESIVAKLANNGKRVMAFAERALDENFTKEFEFQQEPLNFPMDNFIFVGVISLVDPPRPTVKKAIQDIQGAGVKVFMMTGDHPKTAQSIAKSLDLITHSTKQDLEEQNMQVPAEGCKAIVLTGPELMNFTPEDWERTLKHEEIVFARATPQQKFDIINEFQKLGHMVGMVGDGINDAPPLKKADIGIAMGSGDAVTREAAELILWNDNFGSIIDGIQDGRLIFENLKKTICYLITSNFAEMIPFLIFIALRIPLNMETIMIVLIDIVTHFTPAVALAYEETEEQLLNLPPKIKNNHLVGLKATFINFVFWGVIKTIPAFLVWSLIFQDRGFTIDSLIGAGPNIRDNWGSLSQDRKDFFGNMCRENQWFQENRKGITCQGDFMDELVDILNTAQSAYFMAIFWAQIGSIFIMKTQRETIFNWYKLLRNKMIYVALAIELAILFTVLYIPNQLIFSAVPAKWAFITIWIIPTFIIIGEIRKYICRGNPNGLFAKLTTI